MKNKLILLFLSSLPCGKRNSKVGDRGFTLIEVIVAMVILSVFIVVSLSALVTGLNFKLKAKLNNEATLIINQDLEQFRYVASQLGIETVSSVPTTPADGATTISGTTLNLTLPIVDNGTDYLSSSTLNSILTIGEETTAYTLSSVPASNATSIAVTVDPSKINKRFTTLGSTGLALGSVSSITVADASYFQAGDRVVVGSLPGAIFSFVVTSVNTATNTISFASPLTTSQSYAAGTRVVALPRIGDVIPNTSLCTGTSTLFNSLLAAAPNKTNQSVTFNGRTTYQITRTTTQISTTATDPAVNRARSQVVYSVKDTAFSTSSDLATLTTEVIPNVAFKCP